MYENAHQRGKEYEKFPKNTGGRVARGLRLRYARRLRRQRTGVRYRLADCSFQARLHGVRNRPDRTSERRYVRGKERREKTKQPARRQNRVLARLVGHVRRGVGGRKHGGLPRRPHRLRMQKRSGQRYDAVRRRRQRRFGREVVYASAREQHGVRQNRKNRRVRLSDLHERCEERQACVLGQNETRRVRQITVRQKNDARRRGVHYSVRNRNVELPRVFLFGRIFRRRRREKKLQPQRFAVRQTRRCGKQDRGKMDVRRL